MKTSKTNTFKVKTWGKKIHYDKMEDYNGFKP